MLKVSITDAHSLQDLLLCSNVVVVSLSDVAMLFQGIFVKFSTVGVYTHIRPTL